MEHYAVVLGALMAPALAVAGDSDASGLTLPFAGMPRIDLDFDIAGEKPEWKAEARTAEAARYIWHGHTLRLKLEKKGIAQLVRLTLEPPPGGKLAIASYAATVTLPTEGLYAVTVPNTRPLGRQLDYYHEHHKWRDDMTAYRCRIPSAFDEHAPANNEAPVVLLTDSAGANKLCFGWSGADIATFMKGAPDGDNYLVTLTRREDVPFGGTKLEDGLVVTSASRPWMEVEKAYAVIFDKYNGRSHKAPPEWVYEPVFCTWYCYGENIDQDQILKVAARCKELGFGTILIDAGWDVKPGEWWGDLDKGGIGDYAASPERFPDLAGMVRKIQKMGLKVELWAAPFWQAKGSRSYQEKTKDWMAWTEEGEDRCLCPKYPGTRKLLRERFAWIAKTYKIDGMWLDAADGVPPRCLAKHKHLDQQMGPAYVDCLSACREGLRSVNPGAVVEARILHANLNTKKALDVVQCGDSPKSFEMIRLASIHLRPWAYDIAVKNDPMIWPDDADAATIGKFLATMVVSGVPALSVDVLSAPEGQRKQIAAWLAFYKKHMATLVRGEFSLFGADCGVPDIMILGAHEAVVYIRNPRTEAVTLPHRVRRIIIANCTDSDELKLSISPVSGRQEVHTYGPDWTEIGQPTRITAGGLSLDFVRPVPQGGTALVEVRP